MLGAMGLAAIVAAVAIAGEMLLAQRPEGFVPAGALLTLLAVWIAVTDWRTLLIPDAAVAATAILGTGVRLAGASDGGDPLLAMLFLAGDAMLWGGGFLLLRETYYRWRGFDGIGLGDVKLAAAGGVLNGTAGFAWSLLLASLAALLTAWGGSLRTGRAVEKIPFGAFLAPSCCGIWLLNNLLWA